MTLTGKVIIACSTPLCLLQVLGLGYAQFAPFAAVEEGARRNQQDDSRLEWRTLLPLAAVLSVLLLQRLVPVLHLLIACFLAPDNYNSSMTFTSRYFKPRRFRRVRICACAPSVFRWLGIYCVCRCRPPCARGDRVSTTSGA